MKLQFIILGLSSLLFTLPINAQEGWFWQNPTPQGNHIYDIAILDENNIITSMEGGFLLKSTNRGVSWSTEDLNVTNNLQSIFYLTNMLGWITANGGLIMNTTDGGLVWNRQYIGYSFERITDIYFINDYQGCASSSTGSIFRSSDGGLNWMRLAISNNPINKLFFVNNDTGWAVGNFSVYKTINGGNSWIKDTISVTSHNYTCIFFTNKDTGWIGTSLGDIFKTVDGGTNWTVYSIGSNLPISDLYFSNYFNGWAVGSIISYSSDGGESWDTLQGGINSYNAIAISNDFGLCVGNNGLMSVSDDNGITWNTINNEIPTCTYINSVYFLDQFNGFACGSYCNNSILKTSDGGQSWIPIGGSFGNLFDVFFLNFSLGFAGGEAGSIYRTTDGGSSWAVQFEGDVNYSISFVDELNGWIASTTSILKTTNGGINWQTIFLTGNYVLSIYFINQDLGFAAGINRIFKTTDGGENWTEKIVSTQLNSIQFIDDNVGWAVGDGGVILKTTDCGTNWNELNSDTTATFKDVYFIDSNKGWIVGGAGILLSTTDGGMTWLEQVSNTRRRLNSVHFLSSNLGWCVGIDGTILKTTNGGITFTEEEFNPTQPNSFLISQNYPNPFNPSTKIKYSVNSTQIVTLKVYDLLGREIATLVNEAKPAGEYEVEFDGTDLPSGIYFYHLTAGNYSETKKMVLIK